MGTPLRYTHRYGAVSWADRNNVKSCGNAALRLFTGACGARAQDQGLIWPSSSKRLPMLCGSRPLRSVVLSTVLLASFARAQVTTQYFADPLTKENGTAFCSIAIGDRILVGGASYSWIPSQPSMTLLDTLGQVVWTTALMDTDVYAIDNFSGFAGVHVVLDGGDGAVYGIAEHSTQKELWKVDLSNGRIMWKVPLEEGHTGLAGLDATRLLVFGGGYMQYIDRATGQVALATTISAVAACVDASHHLYYAIGDSIAKADLDLPAAPMWGRHYGDGTLGTTTRLYVDAQDSLFAFGSGSNYHGRVIAVNAATGALRWHVIPTYAVEVYCQDVDDAYGRLYVTWRQALVGSGTWRFQATCLDKATGAIAWDIRFHNPMVPSSPSNQNEGALSSAVDASGDLYMTGYTQGADFGPGSWATAKVNGATGDTLYSRILFVDPTEFRSQGCGMLLFHDRPYCIGNITNGSDRTIYTPVDRATLYALDGADGHTRYARSFNGEHQFPSRAVSIQNSVAGTYVLKQQGRFVVLELYDAANIRLWQRTFSGGYALLAGQLALEPGGAAWISGRSVVDDDDAPYFSQDVDSLHLFRVLPSGDVAWQAHFPAATTVDIPSELVAGDDGNAIFGWDHYTHTYLRRIVGGVVQEVSDSLSVGDQRERAEALCPVDAGHVCYLTSQGSSSAFHIVDRTTGAVTLADTLFGTGMRVQQLSATGDGRFLAIGTQGNYEVVLLYDPAIPDTVWTHRRLGVGPMRVLRINDKVYCSSAAGTHAHIERLVYATGQLDWTYTTADPDVYAYRARALAYDPVHAELVVAAQQDLTYNGSRTAASILWLDDNGALAGALRKTHGFVTDPGAFCAMSLTNGSLWVGGGYDTLGYGRAGFLMALAGPDISLHVAPAPGSINSVSVFPDPITDGAWIGLGAADGPCELQLFDALGRCVHTATLPGRGAYWLARGAAWTPGPYVLRIVARDGRVRTAHVLIQ